MSNTIASEPLHYHRMLRGIPNYRWWKPLVFGLLSIVFGFSLTQLVGLLGMFPLMLTSETGDIAELEQRLVALDTQDPVALAVSLASLAVWVPAVMLAALATGVKPVGRIWSVTYRIRWSLLFKTMGPALLAFVVTTTLGVIYGMLTMTGDEVAVDPPAIDWNVALISLAIVFLLVPLQAAAEEIMFRGAFMQVLGAWIKHPAIPILLPSLLFALAHLYDPWALVQVGAMGVVAGWLTWRTGGLEAAISLHVVNNLVVFIMLATGFVGSTSQQTDTGANAVTVLIQIVGFALYAWLAVRQFERGRKRRIGYVL